VHDVASLPAPRASTGSTAMDGFFSEAVALHSTGQVL